MMAVIAPDITQPDPKARRRHNYSPHRCHADGCQEEAHWRGYCLKHYTQLRKDHPMTEQTAAAVEEKKPENGKPKKQAKTPIPLERFREAVEASESLGSAAKALGITASGVADRCKRCGIQTPAQRLGKVPAKKSAPKRKAEKAEPKTEEINTALRTLSEPTEGAKKAMNELGITPGDPWNDLEAEATALGVIAIALKELNHSGRLRVLAHLQALTY